MDDPLAVNKISNKLTDSKIAPSSPMFPLGVRPRPPTKPAQRSLQHME